MAEKNWWWRLDSLLFFIFLLLFFGIGGFYIQQSVVDNYLKKAQLAFASDRLVLPQDDNAVYYYQQVLRFSSNNLAAHQGLHRVGERYVVLVEKALAQRKKQRAQQYLQRGLQAAPKHAGLLALKQRL